MASGRISVVLTAGRTRRVKATAPTDGPSAPAVRTMPVAREPAPSEWASGAAIPSGAT